MKYTPPSAENRTKHKTFFEETFAYRHNFIQAKGPTITEVIEMFPRIEEMPELVSFIVQYLKLTV